MSTALKLITQALRILGVVGSGEQMPASEANEGLDALNQMLDQWSLEGHMIYHVTNTLYPVTAGVSTYDIGPVLGTTWSTGANSRPLMIQKWGSFVRQTISPTIANDYKLEYWNNETYQSVFLKSQTTNFPSRFTYIPGYPTAQIILWPVPTLDLQFSLSTLDQFQNYRLADTFELPQGYESAIAYNLAVELAPQYGVEPPQIVYKKAQDTKSNIMTVNMEQVLMKTDPALEHGSRRPFNIFAGIFMACLVSLGGLAMGCLSGGLV